MEYTSRDVICLRLAEVGDVREGEPVPETVTVPGLDDALELGGSVSDRVDLLSDLEALKEEGIVEEQVRPVANLNERRRAYFLTETGRERVAELRRRAREETVTVTNGTTREVPLPDVEQYFDDAGLVRALARLTADGRVPLERRERSRFVGRDRELDSLRAAYDALDTRGGNAVLVGGESGVGKSTLVDEFLAELPAEASVARTTCEPDAGRPYEAVRRICEALPLAADTAAMLADASADPEDESDAVAGRRQSLFADFADALREVAEDRAVVLVVEDVHNADEATVALLEHLVDALGQWVYRALFVLTYRPEVVTEGHPLAGVVDRLETGARHETVELAPLGRDGTAALLRRELDADDLPGEFVRAVHDQTGGNPLFVDAVASRVAEAGTASSGGLPVAPDAIDVPATVTSAVRDRLSVLDRPGRRVLDLGAVIGESIDEAVLLAAAESAEPTVRDYLDLFVESGIWERDGDDLDFVHGVVRRTVLSDLPADRRAAYHRRVAAAIEAVAGEDADPATLARHHREAGDDRAAVSAFRAAGDEAAAVYAFDLALDAYEQGLAVARESDDVPAEGVAGLARETARVNLLVGEVEAAAEALATAREHAADDATPSLAVERARLAIHRGDFDAALDAVAAALERLDLESLDEASPAAVTACQLLDLRAEAQMRLGNHEAARTAGSRQRDLAATAGSTRQRARADTRLGRVARHRADFAAMRTHHEAALALYERIDADYDVAQAKTGLAIGALKEGDADRALSLFQEARAAFEDMGARPKVARAHSNIGKTYLQQGRYDRASEAFEVALELDKEIGNRHLEVKTVFNLGLVAAERGDHEDARSHFQEALETCEDLGDTHGITISRVRLALALIELGDLGAAEAHIEAAVATASDIGATSAVATAHLARGNLARARDDPGGAREAYELALALFRESGERKEEGLVSRQLAGLAIDRGDAAGARDHAERALAAAEDLGALPGTLESRKLLVEAAALAGDDAAVRTHCERALAACGDDSPGGLPVDRSWVEAKLEAAGGVDEPLVRGGSEEGAAESEPSESGPAESETAREGQEPPAASGPGDDSDRSTGGPEAPGDDA